MLSKNGGAFPSVTPTVNDRGNGYYTITPSASHRDTLGENAWLFYDGVSGYLPRVEQVVTLDPFANEADAVAIGGDTQSLTDLKDFADSGYDPASNKVQGVVLVDTTTTNSDMRGTDSAALATALATHDGKLDTADAAIDAVASYLPALELTAIAQAVRTELTTELARIDAAITTRLATAGYTAPDNTTIGTIDTKLGTPAADVSADVAAIKADTATLLGRITSAVGSMFSALVAMISAGKFTATALENTPAASVDLTPVTDELAKVPRSDTAIAAGGVYTLENQDAEEISISIRTGA